MSSINLLGICSNKGDIYVIVISLALIYKCKCINEKPLNFNFIEMHICKFDSYFGDSFEYILLILYSTIMKKKGYKNMQILFLARKKIMGKFVCTCLAMELEM